MKRRRGREDDESEVNLTPMLDVVFIMLIFFIVTASFIKEAGIDVSRPPPGKSNTQKASGNIVVLIDDTNQIWVAGRPVDARALRANIERLHAENPQGKVIINAYPDSDNGLLVQVMDSARQAGVDASLAAEVVD